MRHISMLDKLITESDRVLRTLAPGEQSCERPSPARAFSETELSDAERKHIAGLMRVNHAGEVCAQALYQGQALTAKLPSVREEMNEAAKEEVDHLVWCEERLSDLGERTSLFNPFWYAGSFMIGAGAGLISDKMSLGFVAATEDLVCDHLQAHRERIPAEDQKTHAVLQQMYEDEEKHGQAALDAGGYEFPAPVKFGMKAVSKLMTSISYRI